MVQQLIKPFKAKPLNSLTLPLKGSCLIEASAGTGKTYTIAILYLRLILGHGQDPNSRLADQLTPKDILVVTFTEAATKELSARIRDRLAQAAEVFDPNREQPFGDDVSDLVSFRDVHYPNKETWSACQKKIMLALELMDEAAISTIHSWCLRMLKEHAFDSGSLFEQTLIKDESELFAQAIKDYWRVNVYPLNSERLQLFQHHYGDLQKLATAVGKKHVVGHYLNSELASLQDLSPDFASRVHALKQQDWDGAIAQALDFLAQIASKQIASSVRKNSLDALCRKVKELSQYAESPTLVPTEVEKGGLKLLTSAGFDKLASEEYKGSLTLVAYLDELSELSPLINKVRVPILVHACQWVQNEIANIKRKQYELGFNELISGLHGALQLDTSARLKTAISEQFPAVLIDEFQDTDDKQYEIFNSVYEIAENHQNRCVLFIGDPKQAIYSFRGGDIYTYLLASFAVGQNKFTLDTNYRSSSAMVSAVNTVFEQAERIQATGAFAIAHNKQKLLPFEPVKANGLNEQLYIDGKLQKALSLHVKEGSDRLTKPRIAEHFAGKIASILNGGQNGESYFLNEEAEPSEQKRSVQASDIAILVTSKSDAAYIKNALQARGIRSYYVSDRGSILHTQEAQEMLMWLRAVAEPKQVGYLRAALATSILAKSIDELHASVTNDALLDNIFEDFAALNITWQRYGVLPMLMQFLHNYDIPQRLLDPQNSNERALTNILHIGELLQEASKQIDGIQSLLNHYQELLSRDEQDNTELIPRLESEKSLVQIVTFHKSKGLQYPIVFIPYGTGVPPNRDQNQLISFHNDELARCMTLSPSDDEREKAQHEALSEQIRTLYVALTRAQYATFVGMADTTKYKESALCYITGVTCSDSQHATDLAGAVSRLCEASQDIARDRLDEISNDSFNEAPPVSIGQAREAERYIQSKWRFFSYSSLAYQHDSQQRGPQASESVEKGQHHIYEEANTASSSQSQTVAEAAVQGIDQFSFPKGAQAGTFLHNILEWACIQGFGKIVEQPELLREHVTTQCELFDWADYTNVTFEWMLNLIQQPFAVASLAQDICLLDLQTLVPELEFLFKTEQATLDKIDDAVCTYCYPGESRPRLQQDVLTGMLKGFIDLCFEHQGQYFVLDYKSNYLGASASDYTESAMRASVISHRYDLQYVIYLVALQRLLKTRLPNYSYDEHIGGAVYYFLRGVNTESKGIFTANPPRELIDKVDNLFMGKQGVNNE